MRASSLLLPVLWAVGTAAVCTKSVTVKSGDTCDALAISQGVSSYQINHLNNNACSNLQLGQVLCMIDTTYNCQPVYTVKPGDYCYGISDAHGISFERFIANNPQLNPTSCPIYPGMTVCVSPSGPSTTALPPTTISSTPTPTPTPTSCTRTATVKAGDTCDGLAQSQGVSSYQINFLNNNGCGSLQIGQVLCLASTTYNCQPVYTVQSGDSCYGIADTRGITFARLISNNPQLNANTCAIYPGMTLCVSSSGSVTTSVPPTSTTVSGTTSGTPVPTGTCTRSVAVKAGDTCDGLAIAQGVSSYQMNFLNNNVCSNLQIGQVLCVASSTYNCQPVYTVQPGDSCYGISDARGISFTQFIANNPQLQPATCAIYPGMSVCVSPVTPGGTSIPPTSTTSSTPSIPTPTGCTKYTTVKAGESCDLIAQRSQISIYDLQRINPTISCATLIQGHPVCVDDHTVNCSAVYIVNGTEGGCSNIASAHDITFSELRVLNPNVNQQCSNVYVGQVLCVAPDLPQIPPVSGCTRQYTIVVGDTCPSVSAKNSLTSVQLQAMNPNMNCNALAPGDTVCSFSPALNICPSLSKVATGDSCFDVAQRAEMSLVEWLSINPSINCEALIPGNLVCNAHGNATLPTVPSGSNPTSVPNCGSYNKSQQCCTKFSVAADLFSHLCRRANGCQDNCVGDPGVTTPTAAATPTTTLTISYPPTPTATPNCSSCGTNECCSTFNICEPSTSWFCETTNGCKSNCDNGAPPYAFAPGQVIFDPGNYTFPPGDYSATDGNPCGVCNAQKAGMPSRSGNYCCTQNIQCAPIHFAECKVEYGCLYNCLDVSYQDEVACGNSGNCVLVTSTVKHPFGTQTPAP